MKTLRVSQRGVRVIFKRLFQNRLASFGAGLTLILILISLMAPVLAPRDPLKVNLSHRLEPPSRDYLLGTDNLGRCLLSRTLYGARVSLIASLSAAGLAILLGMVSGLVSGLGGPKIDTVFMRMADLLLAFPGLILALVLTGITGPSLKSTVLGVGLAGCAWWARFIRGLVLTAKEKEYIFGGIIIGVQGIRLIRDYILPQILPPILVTASLSTAGMLVAISGLSYLGLGIQPPAPEWGMMLREARIYMIRAPWLMAAPGIAITISVLAFNLLGEGLRDIFQIRQITKY